MVVTISSKGEKEHKTKHPSTNLRQQFMEYFESPSHTQYFPWSRKLLTVWEKLKIDT